MILTQLAEKLYKLFVVNPNAAAIQQPNGKYITKYFPFTPFVLENMLKEKGSIGCYQQGYKNGLVRWICLDFDCNDKETPNIKWLYKNAINPCTAILDKYEINYLTEYSGRRGIHVWIIFDGLFQKSTAYRIVEKIISELHLSDEVMNNIGIDKFPATDSAKGNKVGKQVKIPLSVHKSGKRSFFFTDNPEINAKEMEEFYSQQLKILNDYKVNSVDIVKYKLKIEDMVIGDLIPKYYKFRLLNKIECSVDDVERILSKTRIYNEIFERLKSGLTKQRDWYVILGTLGCIDATGDLLVAFFETSPAFDPVVTKKNILKWKNNYYPATFSYLYQIYDLSIEEELDGNQTGLEYLLIGLQKGQPIVIDEKEYLTLVHKSELKLLGNIKTTWEKEKKYFLNNDEVVSVSILNDLKNIRGYDFVKIERDILDIRKGIKKNVPIKQWTSYIRIESEEKKRRLISLGAYDRILTTHLALNLCYQLKSGWKSYSYNVFFASKDDIFYNWYTSWGNYIDKISTFLDIPYLSEFCVMVIDIKGFYDNIDFLAVYKMLESSLDDEEKNIFRFLVQYNDELMREINEKKFSRFGVPQGPAYARIMAELFLSKILEQIPIKCPSINDKWYEMYRYVDDMVFFYEDSINGNDFFSQVSNLLCLHGLEINHDKSKTYGKIKDLTIEERNYILRKDKFNYQLQTSDQNRYLDIGEKYKRFESFAYKKIFDINDVSYVFGEKTDTLYQKLYFYKYKNNIFESIYGKGSMFIKFYKFLYENNSFLEEAIQQDCFSLIPLNSLNFKNCVSQLYFTVQKGELDNEYLNRIKKCFLEHINVSQLDDEERTTIQALLSLESMYEYNNG